MYLLTEISIASPEEKFPRCVSERYLSHLVFHTDKPTESSWLSRVLVSSRERIVVRFIFINQNLTFLSMWGIGAVHSTCGSKTTHWALAFVSWRKKYKMAYLSIWNSS